MDGTLVRAIGNRAEPGPGTKYNLRAAGAFHETCLATLDCIASDGSPLSKRNATSKGCRFHSQTQFEKR